MEPEQRTAITYRYERWRAALAGVLEAGQGTFLLLIAVQWFEAGAFAKAMIVSGGSIGLILGPLIVAWVEARQWPVAQAAARMMIFGSLCFFAAALSPHLVVYVTGAMLGTLAGAAFIPLITQIYQDNYPKASRGRFYSRTFAVRITVTMAFSWGAGFLLTKDLGLFRWLLLLFAIAMLGSAYCLHRIPSRPLVAPMGSRHPLRGLRYVRDDGVFRRTLISWMILGFANLMMLPLRIEFLANPVHGMSLRPDEVAMLTAVIPNAARLVLSPVWGWAFDRMNFFTMRISVNCGLALYILAFFATDSQAGLIIGAVLYGASIAGGDVAWSLWVTKLAPPDRVADYMGVHTLFTGIRGVAAPLVAFYSAAHLSLGTLAWTNTAMIVIANLVLLPDLFEQRWKAAPRQTGSTL